MRKRIQKSPLEVVEMIDESDSSEDSLDEDYELGDDLFSKTSSKGVTKKSNNRKKYTLKRVKRKKIVESKNHESKFTLDQDVESDSPPPPNTSRLFQIVITRKHARLSSCLQRTYLSLSSEDKYVTISEVLSFICECAGFKPNLINRHHLEDSSLEQDYDFSYSSSEFTKDNFGWDSFRNCYSDLRSTVTYKDVLKYKDIPELSEETFYGKSISFEHGDSISHKFYSMCNNRMKILTKKLDFKDAWMIDFVSVGFQRFCEFFSELVLQVEMQYFQDLLLLLQWVFTLSLSPYRSIRFLSCVVCNELISSLLLKLETLKKDQIVLKKQLSVEAELDRRASGRLGGTSVNLSGSTLELYKRLSLVSVTCSVISSFVKSAFHLNYSSKFFDVFPDIRVVSAYYLVVHYLINSDLYGNEVYLDLVSNFVVDQDDNLTLLLKYLLIYKKELNPKTMGKLLQIYPTENKEVNSLVEFLFLKYLNPDNKSSDPETVQTVKEKLFDEEFLHQNILYNNSVYFCCIFLVNYFPDYQFNLKFNLNLNNLRPKYSYAINHANKVYNNYVYTYTRKKLDSSSDTNSSAQFNEPDEFNFENVNTLCDTLSKYQKKDNFRKFVSNLVVNLVNLDFFNLNLSCLRYRNYVKFTTDMDKHSLYNQILVLLVRYASENTTTNNTRDNTTKGREEDNKDEEESLQLNYSKDSRTENLEDFVNHCQDLYKLNRNNKTNLLYLFTIYKQLLSFSLNNKYKLVDLILNNFNSLLNKSEDNLTSLTSVCINILSQIFSGDGSNVGSGTASMDSYKSKINNLFNSNLLKLVKYVNKVNGDEDSNLNPFNFLSKTKSKFKINLKNKSDDVGLEDEEVELVLFKLNHFLISFNFIKIDSKQMFVLFNIRKEAEKNLHYNVDDEENTNTEENEKETTNTNKENNKEKQQENKENNKEDEYYNNDKLVEWFRRNGLYDELLVLYYLLYEYLIYNVVNDPKYRFDGLDLLQHKLLYLLLGNTGVEGLVGTLSSPKKQGSLGSFNSPNSPSLLNSANLANPSSLANLANSPNTANTNNSIDTLRSTKHVFVLLSSVFNVLKLSNVDFLNSSNYKFKLDKFIVDRVLECMAFVYFELYNSQNRKADEKSSNNKEKENTNTENKKEKQNKKGRDGNFEKNKQLLSVMNDGSVSVNYRYCLQSSGLYDNVEEENTEDSSDKNTEKENKNKETQKEEYKEVEENKYKKDYEKYLSNVNNLYVVESLTYQYTKTLNLDLFNSNLSLVVLVNSCSGFERVRKASLKFAEILNRFNVSVFNLLMLHTMFTLYELSQKRMLEKAVSQFNQFPNSQFVEVVYRVMQYVNKNQSNEKFLRYLKMMVFGNVNLRNLYNNNNREDNKDKEYTEMDNSSNNTKESNKEKEKETQKENKENNKEEYKEVIALIKFIKVNGNSHQTEDQYVLRKIGSVLKETELRVEEKNKWFNNNLLALRRSLSVKLVEQMCVSVEKSRGEYGKSVSKDSSSKNKVESSDKENKDKNKDNKDKENKEMDNKDNEKRRDDFSNEVEVKKRGRKRKEVYPNDTTLVSSSQGFYNDMTTDNPLMDNTSDNTTKGKEEDNKDEEEYKEQEENTLEQYSSVRKTRSSTKSNKEKKRKKTNEEEKDTEMDNKDKQQEEYNKKNNNKENKETQKEENKEVESDESPVVRRYSKRLAGTGMWLKNKASSFGLKGLSFGSRNKDKNKENKKENEEESESMKEFDLYLDELSDSVEDFNVDEYST